MSHLPNIYSVETDYTSNQNKSLTFTILLDIILNKKKVGESVIYNIPMTERYWKVYNYALEIIRHTCHNVNGYMFKLMFNDIPSYYSIINDFNDVKDFIKTDPITNENILHEKVVLVKH